MAKKNSTYRVFVKVELETEIDVSAVSFEEALIKARELGTMDVVSFDTPHNDSKVKIVGVYTDV